jgi:hypothetical protein
MKLEQIRKRTAYDPSARPTVKAATRAWLQGKSKEYPLGLTLTLKQTIIESTPVRTICRPITRDDCERILRRFQQKLNRQVFGRYAAEKGDKSLRFLPVLEGEKTNKRLHLHMAIGGLPKHIPFNKFDALVCEAKKYVEHVDEQHKVDIADSGWIEYITKETATKNTDNVLWTLFK